MNQFSDTAIDTIMAMVLPYLRQLGITVIEASCDRDDIQIIQQTYPLCSLKAKTLLPRVSLFTGTLEGK